MFYIVDLYVFLLVMTTSLHGFLELVEQGFFTDVAFSGEGFTNNFTYELAGTPCNIVMQEGRENGK